LVVDPEADKYFKNASIKVSSSMDDCVERITCPTTKPGAAVAAFAGKSFAGLLLPRVFCFFMHCLTAHQRYLGF